MNNAISIMLRSCAVAALVAAPIGSAAYAQSQDAQGQQQQPTQGQAANEGGQAGGGQQQGGQNQAPASDQLVATVGHAEIRGADVLTVIGMLPEPLRAQQPDMLVPIALDQLIFRELILKQAREQNLAQDPEVQSLVQQSSGCRGRRPRAGVASPRTRECHDRPDGPADLRSAFAERDRPGAAT